MLRVLLMCFLALCCCTPLFTAPRGLLHCRCCTLATWRLLQGVSALRCCKGGCASCCFVTAMEAIVHCCTLKHDGYCMRVFALPLLIVTRDTACCEGGCCSLRRGVPLAAKRSAACCKEECRSLGRMMGSPCFLLLPIVAKDDGLLYFPAALLLLPT